MHVSALRRKLGSSAIETVRGAGYRMGAVRAKWRSSVRSRATIGASLVLAIALVVGAFAAAGLLREPSPQMPSRSWSTESTKLKHWFTRAC